MERCRQGATILPLGRFQQSACDESVHLTSPQLDLDAGKATPAALTVAAHTFGGRGRAHINHRVRSSCRRPRRGNAENISVTTCLDGSEGVCGRSLKVVQAVADRAKCRFVIPAIDGDGPGGVLDRGGGVRERHNWPPLQEPDEAGLVVPG